MSTFNGLPAHILYVHFIVVLAPLTAILAILCVLWPAARQRLVWLVLVLAGVVAVLTPVTTEAGEYLEHRVGRTPLIHAHAELGDTMIYFAAALLVAAVLLAVVHLRTSRGKSVSTALNVVVAVMVLAAGIGTIVQTYRIGDSGAKSAWADLPPAPASGEGGE
ncbi:hypothetical protein MANY_29440 [Mycolicibacterium anyangense]|uniref:DUF2231 domain-containing protein n=1 Tax=Mycolicibacterium anyangense TaxID=1431246 RepID=A0A6N4WBM7_9MYCO|nr:DUF2231 domain-containing protein [Mycolicibacterium anyangense]BBZ77607.1 hypothetical protein MANY_29440 [Mycolicibacterium anyangense]